MGKEDRLIGIARSWLGTQWQHNQQKKGVAVDCIRFLEAVAIESGLNIEPLPDNYAPTPESNSFKEYLERNFITTNMVEKSNVLLFEVNGIPTHVGIATSKNRFIHANQKKGIVTEHALDGVWLRTLKGVYKIWD